MSFSSLGGGGHLGQKVRATIVAEDQDRSTQEAAFFEQLRAVLTSSLQTEAHPVLVDQLLAFVQSHIDFERDTLGVWVGGFIFVDPTSGRVVPLFRQRAASHDPSMQSFALPYTWRRFPGKPTESLIDDMFYQWRSSESLTGPWDDTHWPPEYYMDLPELCLSEKEQTAARSVFEEIGCHYCPYGEVLFFTLAWRFLLRIAQCKGWLADPRSLTFDLVAEGRRAEDQDPQSLWSTELWTNNASREISWYEHARSLRGDLDAAWHQIMRTTVDIGSATDGWRADWRVLQLVRISSDGVLLLGEGLSPLLAYCALSLELLGNKATAGRLRRYRSQLLPDQPVGHETMARINTLLQETILEVLTGCGSTHEQSGTVADSLRMLHRMARFPVLPYYYWAAVDPVPRAHLVVPVWHSTAETIRLPVTRPSFPFPLRSAATPRTAATNIVGVAVVGVTPFAGLDPTLDANCSTSASDGDPRKRLYLVREYFELLARPVVDLYFYRRVAQKTLIAERMAERALLADMAHRLGNLLSAFNGTIAEIDTAALGSSVSAADLKSISNIGRQNIRQFSRYLDRMGALGSLSEPVPIDLGNFLRAFVDRLPQDYPMEAIVDTNGASEYWVYGRWELLWWIFDELAYNAWKNIRRRKSANPRLDISVSNLPGTSFMPHRGEYGLIRVTVDDNGPLIPGEIKSTIFDFGFSTTGGSGYGLWRVRRIMQEDFDGQIDAPSTGSSNTKFVLDFPRFDEGDFRHEGH